VHYVGVLKYIIYEKKLTQWKASSTRVMLLAVSSSQCFIKCNKYFCIYIHFFL